MSKIKTAGQLRAYLLSCINSVGNGTMDSAKARDITKLAAQVTENLYAEARVAALQIEMGSVAAGIGSLDLGDTQE